MLSISQKHI
ncbi:hypothetical protein MTR67_000385 [Solanum verrucosum]|uniref:Uncharacterized protein n=1 Tax=Solanum verrucosum TaxID=315347 RepID=A0AAF0TBH7_SOLVR|nr:hypothetical protein MTR67_000385 [Solanum verrucosum]